MKHSPHNKLYSLSWPPPLPPAPDMTSLLDSLLSIKIESASREIFKYGCTWFVNQIAETYIPYIKLAGMESVITRKGRG